MMLKVSIAVVASLSSIATAAPLPVNLTQSTQQCYAKHKWCGSCKSKDDCTDPTPGAVGPCCDGFICKGPGTKLNPPLGSVWNAYCVEDGPASPSPPFPPPSPPVAASPPAPPLAPRKHGGYKLGYWKRSVGAYVPEGVDFQVLFNGADTIDGIKTMTNAAGINLFFSQNTPGTCSSCNMDDAKYKPAGVTAPAFINVGGGTGTSWQAGAKAYETIEELARYIKQGSWTIQDYEYFCYEYGQKKTHTISLENFVGIAYDLESSVDWDSLEASLKLVRGLGLQTLVTVAHTGIPLDAATMRKIIASADIDILSPQLYSQGCEPPQSNANPTDVTWDMFNEFKGDFIPSVAYTSKDASINLDGYEKPIDKRMLWPGKYGTTMCTTTC